MTRRTPLRDGQRFGLWTVIEAYPEKGKKDHARCRCDCGTVREIFRPALIAGQTKKCRKCHIRSTSVVGKIHGGWRIVSSATKARVYECTGCGTRTTRFSNSPIPPPPCAECHPTRMPCSRANAARTGISREGIRQRILRGWRPEDAVRLPRRS